MFTCAWCKKETNGYAWTKDKEPLCSEECEAEYYFGLNRGMFSGKASELSKEKRREISEKLHVLKNFRSAMYHTEKEELRGRFKTFYMLGSLIVYAVALAPTAFIDNPRSILKAIAVVVAFVIAVVVQFKLKRSLKLRQMKEDSGYKSL